MAFTRDSKDVSIVDANDSIKLPQTPLSVNEPFISLSDCRQGEQSCFEEGDYGECGEVLPRTTSVELETA